MSDNDPAAEQEWPRNCPVCGTELKSAMVDFDKTNADRPEMRPGEMAAVDYCPNPDCPSHADAGADVGPGQHLGGTEDVGPGAVPGTAPGSLGGDNGGA